MKCWKCGSECEPSVKSCPTCGALLERSEPAGEIGKAMRMLFDRYGAEKVLTNSAYLVNGLGDLTEDSGKVRNRIKMAMDAGAGKAYLEQIAVGQPDASFDRRVRTLLTDEAGLSDKTAEEIAGYFDEMIGWRAEANAQSSGQAAEAKKEPEIERRKPQNDFGPEIDRKKPVKEDFGPEIDRKKPAKEDFGPEIERGKPVEKNGSISIVRDWKTLYFYEKAGFILLPLALIIEVVLHNKYGQLALNGGGPLTVVYGCIQFVPLLLFILSLFVKKSALREEEVNGLANLLLICLLIGLAGPLLDTFSRKSLLEKLDYLSEQYRVQSIMYEEDIADAIILIPLLLRMFYHRLTKKRKMNEG